MNQFTIAIGTRQVIVTAQDGQYWARLYVNCGESATLQCWKGKSEAGARRWAARILGA